MQRMRTMLKSVLVTVAFTMATGLLWSATADAQTYWLGRKAGPNDDRLIYDVQLPDFFVTWMKTQTQAGGGERYTRNVNGRQYTFYKQFFKWHNGGSKPDVGQIALWKDKTGFQLDWKFDQALKNPGNARLVQELHNLATKGDWVEIKPATMVEVQGNQSPNLVLGLDGPYDTASSPSEQTSYAAKAPELLLAEVGLDTVVAWNQYSQGKPKGVRVTSYAVGQNGLPQKAWEQPLPLDRLAGLASDGTNVYVMTVKNEDLSRDTTAVNFRPNIVIISKFSKQGQLLWQRDVNNTNYLGNTKDGKDDSAFYSPLTAGTGGLAYGNGKLLAVLATNTVPDGSFRHQSARYFLVNAGDGSGTKSFREVSWRHSFDQRVIFDGQSFVLMDLGDAGWFLPGAGITVRKIVPTQAGGTFLPDIAEGVYIYTRQSETAGNQNFSFTSMGDLVPGNTGYCVIFSSERNNNVTNRAGFQTPLAEPRNLAMVHVVKNFETIKDARHTFQNNPQGEPAFGNMSVAWGQGGPLRIEVTSNIVDSQGVTTEFRRPANPNPAPNAKPEVPKFGKSTGVVWLTNHRSGVSVERPKMVRSGNNFLVMWEEWSYQGTGQNLSYQSTKAMLINEQGGIVVPARNINARLNPSGADQVRSINGRAVWVTGDSAAGVKNLHTLQSNLTLSTFPLN